MEFGRVSTEELDHINFDLNVTKPSLTPLVLSGKRSPQFNLHLGCAKWGRKDWVGKIYPKGTKDADFLSAYAKQFNCIEFNAIYYKLPSHEQVRTWKGKVGQDFLFCPKFTEVITHGSAWLIAWKKPMYCLMCFTSLARIWGLCF